MPCRGCTERVVGCHSKCEKYISFRKKLDETNKLIRKNKEAEVLIRSYEADKSEAIRKRQGKF